MRPHSQLQLKPLWQRQREIGKRSQTIEQCPMNLITTPAKPDSSTAAGPAPFLSPSHLWTAAGKLPVTGEAWPRDDTHCILCGADVHKGDPAQHYTSVIDDAFNFKLDCKTPGEAVCGHCLTVWDTQWMQSNAKSYAVQGQGIFNLRTKNDVAALILSPPTAPYVAIFNIRQQAQMIWRTPVTWPSRHFIQVRLDDTLLTIDIRRVLGAVVAWQEGLSILHAIDKAKAKAKAQTHMLNWDLQSMSVGTPIRNNHALVASHSDAGRKAMATLDALTIGDWWGLTACRELDLSQPSTWPQPVPVTLKG